MRLNPDCIRDILFRVENRTDYETFATFIHEYEFDTVGDYSPNEIMYHIRQCDHSGLFLGQVTYVSEGCIIKDLSPFSHEFLANIRQDTNWNKTKEIATKVGSSSLSAIKDIATQVIANLISNQFGN